MKCMRNERLTSYLVCSCFQRLCHDASAPCPLISVLRSSSQPSEVYEAWLSLPLPIYVGEVWSKSPFAALTFLLGHGGAVHGTPGFVSQLVSTTFQNVYIDRGCGLLFAWRGHEISEEDLERTQNLLEIGSCRPLSQCCLCLEFSIANLVVCQ
jgi:hypothetical protein